MNGANANPSASRCALLLVRHAHTEMAGRFCGHSDPPLSVTGMAQLAGLNNKIMCYPITHIFSSDLQRARQTAEAIAQLRKLQVTCLDTLRELALGSWEGLDWDQVVARDPEYAQRWLDNYPYIAAPGGECFADFLQRVQRAMTAIAGGTQDGCAVVVTHGGVIRTFLGSLTQTQGAMRDGNCDYASFRQVFCDAGEWRVTPDAFEDWIIGAPRVTRDRSRVLP